MKYPGESEFIEDIRLKTDVRISTFVLGGFLYLGTIAKRFFVALLLRMTTEK